MVVIYLCCWLLYFIFIFIFSFKVFINLSDFIGVSRVVEFVVILRYIILVINFLFYMFFKCDFWLVLWGFFVLKCKVILIIRYYFLMYVLFLCCLRLFRKDLGFVVDSIKVICFEELLEIFCIEFEGVKKYIVYIIFV